MEVLKITKANALLAFEGATTKQKTMLSNLLGKSVFLKTAIDRIKTYEDACEDQGIQPIKLSSFDFLPQQDRKHAFASHKLTVIIKSLNEGWVPDWSNGSEAKYYGWFSYAGSGSGFSFRGSFCDCSGSALGSRLLFHTSDLATYAGKQFTEIYNQYING